jgi:aspartyl-tRNA(Asn)/glutamyl-tRNA(Gln) amidotransferase subunit B
LENPQANPEKIAQENNWIQESDESALGELISEVLAAFPDKVEEYRGGKKGLMGLFVGEVMKRSRGKADPKVTNQLLQKELNS